MFPRIEIPPIVVGETRRVEFPFTAGLAEGETVDSQTFAIRVLSGTDLAPSNILSGSSSEANGVVSQLFDPTVEGVIYEVKCLGTTSAGQVLAVIGKLAVPPATDTEAEDQVEAGLQSMVSYDSGDQSVALTAIPLLTAAQNANGGMYQINCYLSVSVACANGTISLAVYWFDPETLAINNVNLASASAFIAEAGINTTRPLNSAPGTQVLFSTTFSGVVGTPTYSVQIEVVRL